MERKRKGRERDKREREGKRQQICDVWGGKNKENEQIAKRTNRYRERNQRIYTGKGFREGEKDRRTERQSKKEKGEKIIIIKTTTQHGFSATVCEDRTTITRMPTN